MIFKATTIALMSGAISTCMGNLDIIDGDDVSIEPGRVVTETVQVADFSDLVVAGAYNITVVPGEDIVVTAEGGENIIRHTEFDVEDGTLEIKTRRDADGKRVSWDGNNKIDIRITHPNIEGASIAGSGSVQIAEASGSRFDGSIAGSGDLRIDSLTATSADFSVAGSGDIYASGKVSRLDISIAGSGGFENPELEAESADVSIAGSGDVAAIVTGAADVSIIGSGDVVFTGGAECTVSKAGSGDVTCS
ncbi:head GIN domain-containing protein [Sphingomicrobium aestuariivivum]|uniref:head GIN domain-containing protein n=1 Tax=Sphingomicrobium aestuariivivum TaxID=1582356 RepID=UPI001FD6C56C|nr:head GIN domain-containing protein [Sphingomicrobium aestuariivivum]MCJ8190968.1 DUF2807 domain-containing protein [Sphingomicrobium aestuariivivum]